MDWLDINPINPRSFLISNFLKGEREMAKKHFAWHYLEADGPLTYVFGRKRGDEIVERLAIVSVIISEEKSSEWQWGVVWGGENDWREGNEETKDAAMDMAINTLKRIKPRNKKTMDKDMARVRLMLDNCRDDVVPDLRSYSEVLKSVLKTLKQYEDQVCKIEKIILKS